MHRTEVQHHAEPSPPERTSSGRRQPGVPPTAPAVDPISQHDLERLVDFIQDHRYFCILTSRLLADDTALLPTEQPVLRLSTCHQGHAQFIRKDRHAPVVSCASQTLAEAAHLGGAVRQP